MLGMTTMEVALQRKYQGQANADAKAVMALLEENRKLKEKRSELLLALALEQCGGKAMAAALNALKAEHPDSPLLKETGRTLNTGTRETVLMRDYFAPTFDKAGAERNVKDAINYRSRVE